jgi:hypothetical protein
MLPRGGPTGNDAIDRIPAVLLRETTERAPTTTQPVPAGEQDTACNTVLVCALCGTPITSSSERIDVEGSHEHFKVNPHGVSFRVGCFSSAGNLVVIGPPQRAWSWFAGYAWLIESCAGCGTHLGWLFQGDAHRFHGLLVDALIEQDEPAP